MVDISDELSERDSLLQMKNRLIGLFRKRLVNKFHQDTRSEQEKDQNHGHTAKTPGQGKSERTFRDGAGTEMKDEAVEKPSMVSSIFFQSNRTGENGVAEPLKQRQLIWEHPVLRHDSIFS